MDDEKHRRLSQQLDWLIANNGHVLDEITRLNGNVAVVIVTARDANVQTQRHAEMIANQLRRDMERHFKNMQIREPSLTIVKDVPTVAKGEEDWSLVHIKLPAGKDFPIPNRVLWGAIAGGVGTVMGWVGHMLMKMLSH